MDRVTDQVLPGVQPKYARLAGPGFVTTGRMVFMLDPNLTPTGVEAMMGIREDRRRYIATVRSHLLRILKAVFCGNQIILSGQNEVNARVFQ